MNLGNKVKIRTKNRLFSWLLLLPSIVIVTIFILVPVIDSVIKSFQEYKIKNIISGKPGTWNDFENYIKLFKNAKLAPAIVHTFLFVIIVVIFAFAIGFILALLLNSCVRFAKIIQGVMMTPWIIPTVISALIWLWIYQPQYGLLKYLISLLSGGLITDFAMLNNPDTALFGIAIAALWKQIPLMALLMLAGLQNVSESQIESGKIDGASWLQRLFYIVLPNMKAVIGAALSMAIIENFKQFPLFWTMTGGGPNESTTTLAILSYREAFVSQDLGSGAAVTTVWMILMILVVLVLYGIMNYDKD